jgi:hypothetical protein
MGLGVLIGLVALPAGSPGKSRSSASSGETHPPEEKGIPAAEAKAKLQLSDLAVVDLPLLVAAHPWTAGQEELFAEKLSDARSSSDTQTQAALTRVAEAQRRENRRLVVTDIRKIIAAYAATNGLRLVLDRSATPLTDRPVVEYSSHAVEFVDVKGASRGNDITPAILQVMASDRPKNGLHWTWR